MANHNAAILPSTINTIPPAPVSGCRVGPLLEKDVGAGAVFGASPNADSIGFPSPSNG